MAANAMVIFATAEGVLQSCALDAGCTALARRYGSRHEYEDTLQRMSGRAIPEAMRRRLSTAEHHFAGLKCRIFWRPRSVMRGLARAKAEMAIATLVWNLRRAMKVLGVAEQGRTLVAA